ncbi:MAG TPA: glutamine cyclotransferase [Rikenellaceae bacterium]|nr:glutamine cyclotransferase [Rikenellaceae bacterium]HBH21725.1 glutamine cyclotransferase [Rikenellaceae bacterium]HCZ22936.1 glutamine cyclotransferase [Rikenellaceae bacterium]
MNFRCTFFSCFIFLMLPFAVSCSAKVREYKIKVVSEYVHDISAYTQGLSFDGERFIETTGQFGESSIRLVELKSGKVLRKLDFGEKYFAEGSVVLDEKLYILTWLNKVAFVYDAATLKYEKTFSYPREGWGLTTDGQRLIASDGSSRLYFLDKNLKQTGSVNVTMNGRPVRYLNELEWIDGKVWANVYMTDMIVVINPDDGVVESVIDCTGLLPKNLRTNTTDVLNGIARDPSSGKIYLTGKYWPRLYEIELVR